MCNEVTLNQTGLRYNFVPKTKVTLTKQPQEEQESDAKIPSRVKIQYIQTQTHSFPSDIFGSR